MEIILSPKEVRVLGCLVEKDLTTPEYYPLTLNSLVLACNQKSNRDPVFSLSEGEVRVALAELRSKNLAWEMNLSGSRVAKYEHNLRAKFSLTRPELAVLCVLMLRGPLTAGEIRGCTGRMHPFLDPLEVEKTLQQLIDMEGGPFVVRLPKQSGRKEHRFAHLFSGETAFEENTSQAAIQPGEAGPDTLGIADRLAATEERLAQLSFDLASLKQAFEEFRKSGPSHEGEPQD